MKLNAIRSSKPNKSREAGRATPKVTVHDLTHDVPLSHISVSKGKEGAI